MSMITSTAMLIDVLGGNRKVAMLTGSSPGAVSNWRRNKFPAATYVMLGSKIRNMGFDAPDTLWAMRKPGRKRKATRKAKR